MLTTGLTGRQSPRRTARVKRPDAVPWLAIVPMPLGRRLAPESMRSLARGSPQEGRIMDHTRTTPAVVFTFRTEGGSQTMGRSLGVPIHRGEIRFAWVIRDMSRPT